MRLLLRPDRVGYRVVEDVAGEPGHRRRLVLEFEEGGCSAAVEVCECGFEDFRRFLLEALDSFSSYLASSRGASIV